jgi:hypothetical protein
MIFFAMAINANLHTTLIADFFNSLNFKYGTSLVTAYIIYKVISSGFFYYMFESTALLKASMTRGISLVISIFFFIFYLLWLIFVNIPLAMVIFTGYLLFHSFLAIPVYETLNAYNTVLAITKNFTTVLDDNNEIKPLNFSFSNFRFGDIPKYIKVYGKKLIYTIHTYIFEIIFIITLLSGINIYIKGMNSSLAEKNLSISKLNIKDTFKQLFVWLILINALIIVIIGFYIYNKSKSLALIKSKNDMSGGVNQPLPTSSAVFNEIKTGFTDMFTHKTTPQNVQPVTGTLNNPINPINVAPPMPTYTAPVVAPINQNILPTSSIIPSNTSLSNTSNTVTPSSSNLVSYPVTKDSTINSSKPLPVSETSVKPPVSKKTMPVVAKSNVSKNDKK